jgi:hypothetical protein
MRLRMYVTLPDVASARQLANDLLLARIEDRHMHFLARRGTDLGELHQASYLQKTDTVNAFFRGGVIGAVMGIVIGIVIVYTMHTQLVAVLIGALVGAFLGAWVSSMVGLQVGNSSLKDFEPDIAEGKILLMLDVPASRYEEVRSIIARTHPEALDRGSEPTVPAFP